MRLTLCDYVIIEERTKKATVVGSFTGLAAERFPAIAQVFCAFAILTDGHGDVTMELAVTRLATGEEVFAHRGSVHFGDPLKEVRYVVRLHECEFPAPGVYQFTLLGNGAWVAPRRLNVYQKEFQP